MSVVRPDDVRVVLAEFLSNQATAAGVYEAEDLADDFDILGAGLIDSIGFLGLMLVMQESFGQEIDFDTLDPEEMTLVGPLCRFVAEQANCVCAEPSA